MVRFQPVELFPFPNFVPLSGQLDELLEVPMGAIVARKMIPDRVMEAHV